MIGKKVRTFLLVVVSIAFTAPAGAVEIVYNSSGRPVEFRGLMVDGQPWLVKVTWSGTMRQTYGITGNFIAPKYYGDDAGATLAAQAMQQALIDDGFSRIPSTSYLWIPVGLGSYYYGPGVWLHTSTLDIKPVSVAYNNRYGTVGYTQFQIFKDGFEGSDDATP
jgi:hypothetical protein